VKNITNNLVTPKQAYYISQEQTASQFCDTLSIIVQTSSLVDKADWDC